MIVTQRHLSLGKKARGLNGEPVFFTRPVDRIVIHWIGPFPKQAVSIPWNWWENGSDNNGVQASAHFILKDNDVIQALPLNEVGWHSGDGRNRHSIGIEVIPMNEQGAFSRTTIDTLRLLVKYIRKEKGVYLPLERHYDGTQKKNCPNWYTPHTDGGDERWIALRNYLDDVGRE